MGFKIFDKVMVSPDSTSMYKGRTGQILESYPVTNGEDAYQVSFNIEHLDGWQKSFFRANELALVNRTIVLSSDEAIVVEMALQAYHDAYVERFDANDDDNKADIAAMVSVAGKLGVTIND